jgi:YVTN family beta-propeller protein
MIRAAAAVGLALALNAQAGNSLGKGDRYVLVTYWGDDKIALIDLQAQAGREEHWSIDSLKAGCPKPYDIRANKKSDTAYASCSGGDMVLVIDIVAQQVKGSIKTGASPRDLVLFDDDKKLIVANSGADTVSVIDTAKAAKLYDFSVASQPYGVAVTRDNKQALVTGWASGDLHFFQLGENSAQRLGRVDVGMLPYTVITAGPGTSAYVAANGSHMVAQIDVATRQVAQRIQVGRNPWSLAANREGTQILVTNNRSNNLSLLRTGMAPSAAGAQTLMSAGAQPQASGIEAVRRHPKNASIGADGKTAVFTDLANNQLAVVDLGTGAITKVINVGKAPYGIEYIGR